MSSRAHQVRSSIERSEAFWVTSALDVDRHVLAGNGERNAVHDVWPMLAGWAS